jgi:hypothetical protein
MITPWMKKVRAIALVVTCLLITFAFLVFSSTKSNKTNPASSYKAFVKESFKPLPLYGSNSINTHGPAWTDEAFKDSAASLDPKIVRYPGGGFGDFWDWRKGWFIDSTEAISKHMDMPANFKQTKYSPTGLRELKLLTDKANCEVLFELNMITRDLPDQIEMLKTAESMGFPIKWVELGNEFNLPKSIGRAKFARPRDYGAECNTWAKAIKENFPGAKVGVVGGNEPYSPEAKNWNSTMLDEGSNVDAIVAHIYPIPADVVGDNGIDFENLYDAFKKDFDRMGFEDISHKKIWITEYNIQWAYITAGVDKQSVQKNAFSWGQALSAILMTSEATELPGDPPMIVNHCIANWRGFASVEKRGGRVYMLPNGIGIRAWGEACNNKSQLRQISFKGSGSGTARDYEVLGWQFKGDSEETSLIVNFTANPVTINVTALNGGGKTGYTLMYADKNKTINDWQDVTHAKKELQNNEVELPPYSIATL